MKDFVLAPREATADMLVAGNKHNAEICKTTDDREGINPQVWRDMLAALPAEAFDAQHGTPCAQIRWQQEKERLLDAFNELIVEAGAAAKVNQLSELQRAVSKAMVAAGWACGIELLA